MKDVLPHNFTSGLTFASTIRAFFTRKKPILQTFPMIFTYNLDIFAKFAPVFSDY